jgi:hypothetical protein
MPDSVWNAFFVIAAVGAVVGVLCGADVVSGLALVIFMLAALVIFVVWAVTMLDPQGLAEEPAYSGEDGQGRGHS